MGRIALLSLMVNQSFSLRRWQDELPYDMSNSMNRSTARYEQWKISDAKDSRPGEV